MASSYWQHDEPLKCPKDHTMMWLGSAFWLCGKGKCNTIYVQPIAGYVNGDLPDGNQPCQCHHRRSAHQSWTTESPRHCTEDCDCPYYVLDVEAPRLSDAPTTEDDAQEK
jgi:hypothetical protein